MARRKPAKQINPRLLHAAIGAYKGYKTGGVAGAAEGAVRGAIRAGRVGEAAKSVQPVEDLAARAVNKVTGLVRQSRSAQPSSGIKKSRQFNSGE